MSPDWIIPRWSAPSNVRAAVSTRHGPGVSVAPYHHFNLGLRGGDDAAAVEQNRANLVDALGLPSKPYWLRQVHGTNVAEFDAAGTNQESEADAAITRASGVVLAILTADCLPVLFCADDGSEIAAAHAGWRGLSAGLLENTLNLMRAPRENILAWLGPAIDPRSYEVGDEVREAFASREPEAADAFTATRPGHWRCDLYMLARQRLHRAGIAQIFGGGFDTYTDPRFYSYRRDGASSGRFASLIWLHSQPDATDQNSR